ncbi:hypothetical protein OQA88_2509 [Cercophora sp. LCS_1]
MERPVIDSNLIGLGTKLLREACTKIPLRDAEFANVWEGKPYPVYYKLEATVPNDNGRAVDWSYSRTVDSWYEPSNDEVASADLLLAILGLCLLAAVQPTGKILGRKFDTPWIIRCFPIIYIADALDTLVQWVWLILVSSKGARDAALIVLEKRQAGLEMEHWAFAVTKWKAASPARWAAFAVHLPALLDILDASLHARMVWLIYAGAWLTFEGLILAATVDASGNEEADPSGGSRDRLSKADDDTTDESPTQKETTPEKDDEAKSPETTAPESSTAIKPSEPISTPQSFTLAHRIHTITSTTVILASAIYHAIPLLAPEATAWNSYLTYGLTDPDAPDSFSLFLIDRFVQAAIPLYFLTVVATQDLGAEWLSRLEENNWLFGVLAFIQTVSMFFWGTAWGAYFLPEHGLEGEGYEEMWYLAVTGLFALLYWINIKVGNVIPFRVFMVLDAIIYYSGQERATRVTGNVVCRAGGMCHKLSY